jgi:very-short-patch-repair endonuclease
MLVLCGQIMLIFFALMMFFVYFTVCLILPVFANLSIITGFACLAMVVLLETVAYEENPLRQINFSEEKSNSVMLNKENEWITPQAEKLHKALIERGVHNDLEHYDGHKHVDISISWAKLNLEIDGKYHLTDPEQLLRDLKRDFYSHENGISTIHIQNDFVEWKLDELADAIAKVAQTRKSSEKERG